MRERRINPQKHTRKTSKRPCLRKDAAARSHLREKWYGETRLVPERNGAINLPLFVAEGRQLSFR
jgi:hypothetical protein